VISHPSRTKIVAYFGIVLLRDEIAEDAELRQAVQKNWPRVVFDDHDRGSAMQRAAVSTVYRVVPEIGATRLALKLREDNSRNGYLLTLDCYVVGTRASPDSYKSFCLAVE
jgi:hypothetical protein